MEKKDVQITIHCTRTMKRQYDILSEGQMLTPSQYVFDVMAGHLSDKSNDYTLLKEVFEGNNSNNSNNAVELKLKEG